MIASIEITVKLLADVARFAMIQFRPTRSVRAEDLFHPRQLALCEGRVVQLRWIDAASAFLRHAPPTTHWEE